METKILKTDSEHINTIYIEEAASIIKRGGLVAFPTETVYGLGGNGLDTGASKKIYEAKGRPSDNPLILHISQMSELEPLTARIPDAAFALAERFWPGPMTLIMEKSSIVPDQTTGGLGTVAVRMPSHAVARALIMAAGVPIAAPSANSSGRPSPTRAEHVKEDLNGRIDMILDGGEVGIGLESTIIDLTGDVPTLLRPGYITPDMITAVVGDMAVDPAVYKAPSADVRPKAPGMKYRHYAPKAELTIFRGPGAAGAISAASDKAQKNGQRVGVLCRDENAGFYSAQLVECVGRGDDADAIARNLYDALRRFDGAGVDVIFSESFEDNRLGQVIMNRLIKAAGYRVFDCPEVKDVRF